MAKYQNMLVVIDPNQDDQPALRRAVYLHQRIGGRIKAFLDITAAVSIDVAIPTPTNNGGHAFKP